MKQKFTNALSLALIVAMLFTSVALADNVVNDIDAVGDYTFTAPGSTVIRYKINGTGGDGQNGCNAEDGTPVTVNLSVPAGVTASATSLEFSTCGDFQSVTFSSSTPGSYAINVSNIVDSGAGSYKNEANFTLNVLGSTPSDTTAPAITPTIVGTLGNNGWYTSDVTVSWSVVDNESTVSSTNGCGTTTIDTDTAGTPLTCQATSAGGTSSQTVTIKRDATAPSISAALDKSPDSLTGWFNLATGAPKVSFTCSDAMSGLAADCPASHLFSEGADQAYSQTIYDLAGNSNSAGVSNVDVDLTVPGVSVVLDRLVASSGWFNEGTGAPIAQFTCSDVTSLIATCPDDYTFGEGEDQSHSGTAYDNAGNSASAEVTGVYVDLTDPGITWSNVENFYYGFPPATPPSCQASDDLSGPNGCSVSGYDSAAAVGAHDLTATAYDVAGNEATSINSYTVLGWTAGGFYQPVDMGGVWNTVKNGSTVPLKFELWAGSAELTNPDYVKSITSALVACTAGTEDAIEIVVTATGGTTLRYDATAGQFIFNWKTPPTANKCYRVTMEADDGSKIIALFKLK